MSTFCTASCVFLTIFILRTQVMEDDALEELAFSSPKRKCGEVQNEINEDQIAHKSRRLFDAANTDDECCVEYLDVSRDSGITNVGVQMLERMGWKKGEALGSSSSATAAPIEVTKRNKSVGLGFEEERTIHQKRKSDGHNYYSNDDNDSEDEDIEDLQLKYGILEGDSEKIRAWKKMCVRYRNCV